jgi:hypothetical protein
MTQEVMMVGFHLEDEGEGMMWGLRTVTLLECLSVSEVPGFTSTRFLQEPSVPSIASAHTKGSESGSGLPPATWLQVVGLLEDSTLVRKSETTWGVTSGEEPGCTVNMELLLAL